jgi:hypothetical protein
LRRPVLAATALAVLAALLVLRPWSTPQDPPLPWAVCGGTVHHADAVLTGTLRLHRALLPDGDLDPALLRDAVALQIRHAFGSLHNDPSARSLLTPDGPPHTVEILERADVAYGHDITVDWPADPELHVESDYVRRALARGQLSADDPAIAVTWRAHVRLTRCDADADSPQTFHLPAPHDPYLLYWSVPAAARVEHVYLRKRARTFPCADPQIADYAHPEYLWYYWQPTRPGCEDRPPDLARVDLQISHQTPPSGDLSAWRRGLATAIQGRPLRVVLVFGYLNHQVPRPDPGDIHAALATRDPPAPAIDAEWGSAQYVEFVRRLNELLEDPTQRLYLADGDPAAEIHGTLQRSRQPALLSVHLTETDYLAPTPYTPRHLPLLLAALRDADAILYAGHSGLGLNFSLAQLEQAAPPGAVAAALQTSPVQLLAFIGCYTYSYFGDDLARRLPRQGPLFVYTGNSVADTADSALHVLHTVDCHLPPPGPKDSPDFLVYELAR